MDSRGREVMLVEVLAAARSGRLTEVADEAKGYSWFEIDGRHISLSPTQELVAVGLLVYELGDALRTKPRKVVPRNPCGGHEPDVHVVGEEKYTITKTRDGRFVINGNIYREDW